MNNTPLARQTLALAGIAQSTVLVQTIARRGLHDHDDLYVMINSLFKFDADDILGVYGSVDALSTGLKTICDDLFTPKSPAKAELMRYSYLLIQLAKKVKASEDLQNQLAYKLESVSPLFNDSSSAADEMFLTDLSEVYVQLISPLKPRIIVNGEYGLLAKPQIASKVRVCLLCGIRSAYLWWQTGGSRLRLVTGKNKFQTQAQDFLNTITHH